MELVYGWTMLIYSEKEGARRCVDMTLLYSYWSVFSGDPEVPPVTPPEAPPQQPPEVPGDPVPESEPAPPPEIPPGAPPEVPAGIPPETRTGAVSRGAIR